jgi:hypothetical protein
MLKITLTLKPGVNLGKKNGETALHHQTNTLGQMETSEGLKINAKKPKIIYR